MNDVKNLFSTGDEIIFYTTEDRGVHHTSFGGIVPQGSLGVIKQIDPIEDYKGSGDLLVRFNCKSEDIWICHLDATLVKDAKKECPYTFDDILFGVKENE